MSDTFEETQKEWRSMIKELLQVESGLSDWDIEFLDNVHKRDFPLTDKQGAMIEKIYRRLL